MCHLSWENGRMEGVSAMPEKRSSGFDVIFFAQ